MNVKMSRVPLGKVLLRNVIRHTDAHNKLQEESEMWKIREMEKQAQNLYGAKRRRTSPEPNKWDHNGYKELYPEEFGDSKSRMRSDGFDADIKKEAEKKAAVSLGEDVLSIRALNKKFYKCESSMPDRWGHSGYKELYPEEFDSDSDTEDKRGRKKANGQETRRDRDPKEPQSHKRKRSKKTRKKKQKKRSHKKLKKQKKDHEVSTETSSESDSSDDSVEKPKKSKRKKKTRKKTARRKQPSSSGQDSDSSDEMSSTEDVEAEKRKDRHSKKTRKKQHHRSKPKKDSEMERRKSRRTNWKVAKDEGSDSSDEDD